MTLRPSDVAAWSDAALGRLRAHITSPATWLMFLQDAFARWARDERELPALQRSLRRWLVYCATLTILGRLLVARKMPGRASCIWLLTTWLMADWHLGMIPRSEHDRPQRLGLANRLTLLRAFLPAAALSLPDTPRTRRARVGVAWTALLTDFFDGFAARRLDDRSYFGAVADPLVDAAAWTALALTGRERNRGRLIPWVVATRFLIPPVVIALISFGRGRMVKWQRSELGRWSSAALGIAIVWGETKRQAL